MPTYEYECSGCKAHFEFFQKITEPAKDICPNCGQPLKRLIGRGSGIIFKGQGFYATDYRKKDSLLKSDSEPSTGKKEKEKKN